MSDDAEKIKTLIEFKKRIEKKVGDLESELKELQTMLDAVNSVLLDKGFKHAEVPKKPSAGEISPPTEAKEAIPLKAVTGELLATVYVDDNSLRVVLAEDKNFSIDTPPFNQFLVERVLARMQEKDSELARTGQLAQDKIFSYNVVRDDNTVREITVRNVDEDRLRELKSSIRWTLEKMYEKMRNPV